jgi:hypothetical protein
MRCHICDRPLSEPRYNRDHKDYNPCDTCLTVVQDTLEGFIDKPAADEDELGIDPLWDEYYPSATFPHEEE